MHRSRGYSPDRRYRQSYRNSHSSFPSRRYGDQDRRPYSTATTGKRVNRPLSSTSTTAHTHRHATKRARTLPDEDPPKRQESRPTIKPSPGLDNRSSSRHGGPNPRDDSSTTGSTCDKEEGSMDMVRDLHSSSSPSSPSSSSTPAPPEPVVEVFKETVIALEADEEEERAMSDMLPPNDYPLFPLVEKDGRPMETKMGHSRGTTYTTSSSSSSPAASNSSEKKRASIDMETDSREDRHADEKGEEKKMKDDLPHPWRETLSSKGKIYYFNPQTGAAVWDRPSPSSSSSSSLSSSSASAATDNTVNPESHKRKLSSPTPPKPSTSVRARQEEKRLSADHHYTYHHGHHDHDYYYHHDDRYRRSDYPPVRYRYPLPPPRPALPIDYRRPSARDILSSSSHRDRLSGGNRRR